MCTSTGNFDSIFFSRSYALFELRNFWTFIYKSILSNNDFGNLNMVDLVVTNTFPPTYKPIVSLFTCAIDADLGSYSLTASVCVVESTLSYSYTVVEVTDLTGVEVDGGSEMDTSGVNKALLWPSSGSSSESLSVSPKSLFWRIFVGRQFLEEYFHPSWRSWLFWRLGSFSKVRRRTWVHFPGWCGTWHMYLLLEVVVWKRELQFWARLASSSSSWDGTL